MDVLNQLKAVAARELAVDTSTFEPQTPLADLHIDSLAFVDFLFKVEEEFGVRVPDSSVTDMKTVGDLERAISELVAAAPAKT
jgi:acyl carrier protein